MLQMLADIVMEEIEIRLEARKVVKAYSNRLQSLNEMKLTDSIIPA